MASVINSPIKHVSADGFKRCHRDCLRCRTLVYFDRGLSFLIAKLPLADSVHKQDAYEEVIHVMERTFKLTPKETQVVELLVMGESNKRIAKILKITENTAKVYVAKVLKKLKVTSRAKVPFVAMKSLRRRSYEGD